MKKKLYQELASLVQARLNCIKSSNKKWEDNHVEAMERLVKNYMPSGSGIDNGTKMDIYASKPNKLVFTFSYHHMNDCGMYDGWTDHKLVITPSLASGFDMTITGRDRNGLKEYLYDTYHHALTQEVGK